MYPRVSGLGLAPAISCAASFHLTGRQQSRALHGGLGALHGGPSKGNVRRCISSERFAHGAYPAGAGSLAKLRWLAREYGAIAVCTHFGVYLSTLGMLFVAIDNGAFVASDAVQMLKWIGVEHFVDLGHLNPKASNFAVAWILVKFTEPLRLPVTLWLTPRIATLVRGAGLRGRSSRGGPPAQPS